MLYSERSTTKKENPLLQYKFNMEGAVKMDHCGENLSERKSFRMYARVQLKGEF